MKALFLTTSSAILMISTACAEAESPAAVQSATASSATVSSTVASTTTTADDHAMDDRGLSTLSSGTYVMDKTHGYVTFSYSHLGFSNPILRWDDVDATVELNADDITASTLTVAIDPASINSGVERFDEHLVGDNFFDVPSNPAISFTSTSLSLDSPYSGTLTGDLTMLGVTKPVTLDVTLNKAAPHPFSGNQAFGIQATTTVLRSEWGLGYAVPNVSDEVEIRVDAEFGLAAE